MVVLSLTKAWLMSSALLSLASALALPSPKDLIKTKKYELTITWEKGAPDGVERELFKVNGQFPGPVIEMNEGDNVEIKVMNKSPFNTTVHYHGIEQKDTPWSDGTPGLSQNHIQPGCEFLYKWKATQHGSYWYHSHTDLQIDDGLFGPIIIHPKSSTPNPYSLVSKDPATIDAIKSAEKHRYPMLLSDWRHTPSSQAWDISEKSHIDLLCFDSILVNGKGKVDCLASAQQTPLITRPQKTLLDRVNGSTLTDKSCLPPNVLATLAQPGDTKPDPSVIPREIFYGCKATNAPLDVIKVTKSKKCEQDKWIMLDLIATFSMISAQVSLDEIPLTIIAADGNHVEPTTAQSIPMAAGQRYTVIAKLEKPKKYTLRVSSTADPQILFGTSIIDFQVEAQQQSQEPSVAYINERGVNTTSDVVVFQPAKAKPFPAAVIPQTVDATYKVVMKQAGAINRWAFNSTPRPEYLDDVMPLLLNPQPDLVENYTATIPASQKWVDFVMLQPRGGPSHPVHFHGRHFYVIGEGQGTFTWNSVAEAAAAQPGAFNLVNPPLRDTYPTLPSQQQDTWLVVRRPNDNPGVWQIHCHIQSHLHGGMSMVLQEGLEKLPAIPKEYRNPKCRA
ncbi:multicopper oxidase-domain-containing protein [Apiospora marii]|uniref:Multicopper oxidase-domain-containing protein n=1 Tax=Apiospora marii TaxID=335849 RepID=A0ABR1S7G8_9PEZI